MLEWIEGTFAWAALGSVLVELLTLYEFYVKDKPLPGRYGKPGFRIVRILLMLGAGLLAKAYKIHDNPLLAVNVGASAPLLMRALGRGLMRR